MIRTLFSYAGLSCAGAALALLLAASPANAQTANRAWVSGHGTDTPGCGAPTAPCRSLQYTHDNVVAAGGEIDVLDPAGYGAITISKSISIINDGVGVAGVQPGGQSIAIWVDVGVSDVVLLKGLTVDGSGAVGANTAILLSRAGSLTISHCVVTGFKASSGGVVDMTPNGFDLFGFASFAILDTLITNNNLTNSSAGVLIENDTTPGWTNFSVRGIISRTRIENSSNGVTVDGSTQGPVAVTITDSVLDDNGNNGLFVDAPAGDATADVFVRNSTITNGANGIQVEGSQATVRLTGSAIAGNNAGWFPTGGGHVLSYGDNEIDDNNSDTAAPPLIPHR